MDVWYDEAESLMDARNRVRDILQAIQYFGSTGVSRRRGKLLSGTYFRTKVDMHEQHMYAQRYGLGLRVN